MQWAHKQAQTREIRVQGPCKSSYKHLELLFYAKIHLSIDFGHVSDSIRSAVAGALLRGLQCQVSRKQAFKNLSPALSCWDLDFFLRPGVAKSPKESDGATGMVPNR